MHRLAPLAVAILCTTALSPIASAQWLPYNDGRGREWMQPAAVTGLTWNQIAQVCPTDGATPCSGTVGGKVLTGWNWATQAQVRAMLSDFVPGLATSPSVNNPGSGFYVLSIFRATQAFYSNYSNSEYVGGWTATANTDGTVNLAGASAAWPLISGGVGVASQTNPATASASIGAWLWRPAACPPDMNSSGTLTVQDIFDFLNAWFANTPRGDFNRADGCTIHDIFDYLSAWFAGC